MHERNVFEICAKYLFDDKNVDECFGAEMLRNASGFEIFSYKMLQVLLKC